MHNVVGSATLEELSSTAEDIADDDKGWFSKDDPALFAAAEDAGMTVSCGAVVEELSSQPAAKTQATTDTARITFQTFLFMK